MAPIQNYPLGRVDLIALIGPTGPISIVDILVGLGLIHPAS